MKGFRLYGIWGFAIILLWTGTVYAAAEQPKNTGGQKPALVAPNADVDIVYYFMTTQRCPSCMKIETYAKEAVEKTFATDLKKGSMVWKMVNVDKPENNHFIKDYQLFTKSVVLVRIRGGKQVGWKNLDKVWPLLNNKAAFQAYVVKEVNSFRGKG